MQKCSLLLPVIAGSILTGCVPHYPMMAGSEKLPPFAPYSPFKRVWLPIHQHDNRIIAVGEYQLPEAIVIPPGLKPFSTALVHRPEPKAKWSLNLQVFFPAKQEKAVLKWAQSYPAIIASRGKVQWKYKRSQYTTRAGISKPPPPDIPIQWIISGEVFTSVSEYGVIWDSSIPLTEWQQRRSPELYGIGSPVKDEAHLVEVTISVKSYPVAAIDKQKLPNFEAGKSAV